MYPSSGRQQIGSNQMQRAQRADSDSSSRTKDGLVQRNIQPSSTPVRRRSDAWSVQEIKCLIICRRELDFQYHHHAASNSEEPGTIKWIPPYYWDIISAEMRRNGFDRSSSVCSETWKNLVKEFLWAKRKIGFERLIVTSCYDELLKFYSAKKKRGSQKGLLISEAHPTKKSNREGNEPSAVNLERSLYHDEHQFGVAETDVAANGVSAWNRRGGEFIGSGGKVISVRWGNYVKRIGIDGSSKAIKEAIRSAFGLRTRRPFWLEDTDGIVRSIDRGMPMRDYILRLDEGLTIKIYLYTTIDDSPVQAEEKTFYGEDDFREFLQRQGFIALTDLSCCRNIDSIGDLHPGEFYQGVRALGH